MSYRDARKLSPGDIIYRKSDKARLIIESIILYGQHKIATITCLLNNQKIIVYNYDVEFQI